MLVLEPNHRFTGEISKNSVVYLGTSKCVAPTAFITDPNNVERLLHNVITYICPPSTVNSDYDEFFDNIESGSFAKIIPEVTKAKIEGNFTDDRLMEIMTEAISDVLVTRGGVARHIKNEVGSKIREWVTVDPNSLAFFRNFKN